MRPTHGALAVAALVLVAGCGGSRAASEEPAAVPSASEEAGPATAAPTQTATPAPTTAAPVTRTQARRLGLQAVAALKRDDPRRALALVLAGADVNVRDPLLDSVFLYAAAENYPDVVRAALTHGADPRVLNRYGGTALIPASEHAHLEVIRILLRDSDVEVDHVNDLGWTALGEAVALGDGGPRSQQAVRLLLAAGADPTARDRFGRTVLENAERLGYAEIARLVRAAAR